MAINNSPPVNDKIVDDKGMVTASWAEHFYKISRGDQGTAFTPVATSLGSTGTPTLTGIYYKISSKLVYFRILVTPATNTSSTAATTYFTGLPVTLAANGFCTAEWSNIADIGQCTATGNRIYTPTWTNITVPVTVSGVIEAS